MKSLQIGDLTARYPIIQGGMGVGVSLAGLSSAVANQGGIGVISTVAIHLVVFNEIGKNYKEDSIRALREEIQKAKKLTQGILGVNIMVALSNFAELVKTSIEEKIDIIFSGAGLPLDLPGFLKGMNSKTKLVPIVSSARAARIIIKKWKEHYDYVPDAIVVEGPLAGGHLGFKKEQIFHEDFQLEKLIPEVVEEARLFEKEYNRTIPVIAAGGIYTGEDILKFIKLGAAGVQMGTRFVTTIECDASDEFKQAYLDAKKEDIIIIDSPVGMPGRALKSPFLINASNGLNTPTSCPYKCIRTCDFRTAKYCIGNALVYAQQGKLDNGFAFVGANVYKNDKIISVKELFETLISEYELAEKS